jgi:hypothetical protein
VSLGDGTGLAGQDLGRDVVGGAIVQAAGQVGTLADNDAAFRGPLQCGSRRAGRDQDQLVKLGRGRLHVVSVDRGRLEAALDHAAGQQLRDSLVASGDSRAQIAEVDGQPLDRTAGQTPLDCRPDPHDHLPGDRLRVSRSHSQ